MTIRNETTNTDTPRSNTAWVFLLILCIFAVLVIIMGAWVYLTYSSIDEKGHEFFRTVILSATGVIGLPLLLWRSHSAHTQAQNTTTAIENTNRQLRIMSDGNAQNLYEKSITLMNNKSITQSIAGINSLERLALGHPHDYLKNVIEILATFIQQNSWPTKETIENYKFDSSKIVSDVIRKQFSELVAQRNIKQINLINNTPRTRENIYAALKAISNLRSHPHFKEIKLKSAKGFEVLEIKKSYLCGLEIHGLNLSGIEISNEIKSVIDLSDSIFNDSEFINCKLNHIYMQDCAISGVNFFECSLDMTYFDHSILHDSVINLEDFVSTIFNYADVSGSIITHTINDNKNYHNYISSLFDSLRNTKNLEKLNKTDTSCIGYIYTNYDSYKEKWSNIIESSKLHGNFVFDYKRFIWQQNP